MSWSDEHVTFLREQASKGFTASQLESLLNKRFKTKLSRNAVISKCRSQKIELQSGLNGRGPVDKPKPPVDRVEAKPAPSPKPATRVSNPLGSRLQDIGGPQRESRPLPKEAPVAPQAQPKTLMELQHEDCRFPLGDPQSPDFRFCAAVRENDEKPYCRVHNEVAFDRSAPARRYLGRFNSGAITAARA